MRKCANISPYMRRPLVKYDFATAPFWISVYMRKIWFSFLSVYDWEVAAARLQKKLFQLLWISWSQITYFLLGTAGLRKYKCSPWWIGFRRWWPAFKETMPRDGKVFINFLFCNRWPHRNNSSYILKLRDEMQLKSVRN